MSFLEPQTTRPERRGGDGADAGWPEPRTFARAQHGPAAALPLPGGKKITFHTDRVRAKPAVSPSLSMNIGLAAIGLGAWGTLFPNHMKRTLGIRAPAPMVQAVFGARELATGFGLAADPTKSGLLWARVAGDVFDILALRSLDNRRNRQRGAARAALGFVAAVTVLDLVTAVRMTGVQRNCLPKETAR